MEFDVSVLKLTKPSSEQLKIMWVNGTHIEGAYWFFEGDWESVFDTSDGGTGGIEFIREVIVPSLGRLSAKEKKELAGLK